MDKLHTPFQGIFAGGMNLSMKKLTPTILIALFLLVTPTLLSAEEPQAVVAATTKQVWLKFSGTNYCKPGFCADGIPVRALTAALNFYKNNQSKINNSDYVGVIDFTLKSTIKRFFILNLKDGSVESLLVTHGKKSETETATAGAFSNDNNSEMSSLGFYITDTLSYVGKHGTSLRLDGVSETNSNARLRNIVLHGADYATEWFATTKGRLGLSQGCPAVAPNKIGGVINKLKGQALLYIHKDNVAI